MKQDSPEAQLQGGERHRFRRGGRVNDQMCGQCNAVADAPIHQMGDIERAAAAQAQPATGETTVEATGCEHCTCTCDNCAPCGERKVKGGGGR